MAFIPEFIFLLLGTVFVDFYCAKYIGTTDSQKMKRIVFWFNMIFSCGILFVFKYYNFFNENILTICEWLGIFYQPERSSLILPLGISFYTFQSLSYVIEVYRGTQKCEKHLGYYALYVLFYPQLVAGPIERPGHLLGQFRKKTDFNADKVIHGLKLMAWGFFKKVVIADRLAVVVEHVYSTPYEFSGISLFVATFFFAFQIYCDFSGYSDIAIGAAEVMDIELMKNFRQPYTSRSISEFWKRWHISLMSWFRDYIYIPLGGNRVSELRWIFNTLFVFLLSGLWHGANWTFVAWGGLNGLYIIGGKYTLALRSRIAKVFHVDKVPSLLKFYQVTVTFTLICITWVFFRANNITEAIYIVKAIPPALMEYPLYVKNNIHLLGKGVSLLKDVFLNLGGKEFVGTILLLSFLYLVELYSSNKKDFRKLIQKNPFFVRWFFYYVVVAAVLILSNYTADKPFIYFQF